MKSPSNYHYCGYKKRHYASEEHAQIRLKQNGGVGNVYKCPKCKNWHYTHNQKFKVYRALYELFE